MAGRGEAFHDLEVARVEQLCDDAAAVTFAVPADLTDTFAFRPGQFLTLRRVVDGVERRRSYSISSPVGAALRIGVREVAEGAVSGWLVREVRPGDFVAVGAPSGNFTPDLSAPGRHVLVAAGSGITPVLSIAGSVLADGASEALVVYGNRRSDTVMFADDLADLKDAHLGRAEIAVVLSREAQEVELFNGRLDAAKLRELLPILCDVDAVDHWWFCGPHGMVSDACEVLEEMGVPADRVHRELFYVEEAPPEPTRRVDPSQPGSAVTIVLDGRSTVVTIPHGTAVLDGAQRVRPDLPFACRGGVCGTCRARVTSGQVEMRRNFALEPAEVDAGYVLTCQARCTTDAVTVDYDA